MPDEEHPAESEASPPVPNAEAVTPGGYAYEVVDDGGTAAVPAPDNEKSGGVPAWALVVAAIVPAVLVGGALLFLAEMQSSQDEDALTMTGAGLLNAFTSGGDATTTRFEGELPPGYPDDVPTYDGSTIVASVVQVSDPNAGYIVAHHSDDDRDTVAAELQEAFGEGSWQVDGVQESRDATLIQFSKVDDAAVSGIALLTASKDEESTTIITSIQDAEGAADQEDQPFTEPSSERNVPTGFPSEIPVYEGSTLIESAFQKGGGATSYALSYITADEVDAVEAFYRQGLEDAGLTVEDGDASTSPLEDARVISFSNADETLQGEVAIGVFAEDDGFTRIDVQVGDERDGGGPEGDDPTPEDAEGG